MIPKLICFFKGHDIDENKYQESQISSFSCYLGSRARFRSKHFCKRCQRYILWNKRKRVLTYINSSGDTIESFEE
jgi:hypothetical protein